MDLVVEWPLQHPRGCQRRGLPGHPAPPDLTQPHPRLRSLTSDFPSSAAQPAGARTAGWPIPEAPGHTPGWYDPECINTPAGSRHPENSHLLWTVLGLWKRAHSPLSPACLGRSRGHTCQTSATRKDSDWQPAGRRGQSSSRWTEALRASQPGGAQPRGPCSGLADDPQPPGKVSQHSPLTCTGSGRGGLPPRRAETSVPRGWLCGAHGPGGGWPVVPAADYVEAAA